jgi:hypothetical protein
MQLAPDPRPVPGSEIASDPHQHVGPSPHQNVAPGQHQQILPSLHHTHGLASATGPHRPASLLASPGSRQNAASRPHHEPESAQHEDASSDPYYHHNVPRQPYAPGTGPHQHAVRGLHQYLPNDLHQHVGPSPHHAPGWYNASDQLRSPFTSSSGAHTLEGTDLEAYEEEVSYSVLKK